MERDEFEKLYRLANTDEQLKLQILWEAYVENIKAFQKNGQQKNLKLWQEAEKALNNKAKELRAKYLNRAPSHENRLAAFNYLKAGGYKIGRQKLYDDAAKGFLAVEEDGSILHAELERYATTLTRLDDAAAIGELTAGSAEKLQAEINQIRERTKSITLDREIKAGKYLPAADVKTELAVKAAALKAGIFHVIETQLRDVLQMAGGDLKKLPTCISFFKGQIEDTFHDYATGGELIVNISD